MKNGVPMDAAFALCDEGGPENDIEALAMSVAYGELAGGEFDWANFKWLEKKGA